MSSSDRRPYRTAITLDQALLDACHDNLECKLEMVCEIETPTGTIYASDRNKYVGSVFYEALMQFPVISRTVGEWLLSELQFATQTVSLSNVDGRFNNFLQGGADFGGWIGKQVSVKVGLADKASTYVEIFRGFITPLGGFKRSTKSITVIARDQYDRINQDFPTVAFKESSYPKIESRFLNKLLPIIYGDWTIANDPVPASVPGYATNGHDPMVHFQPLSCTMTLGSPGILFSQDHDFDNLDLIQFETTGTLPTGLAIATDYYVRNATADTFNVSATPAGALITFSGPQSGDHKVKPGTTSTRENVKCTISYNSLDSLSSVYLKRGDVYYLIPATEIVNIGINNNIYEVKQSAATWLDLGAGSVVYEFSAGDEFAVLCHGKSLGSYSDNIVEQARDLLLTYGNLISGDFDANWDTYRDKAAPAQSNIAGYKSRVWVADTTKVLTYALSMLEQVRLEAFIDRNLKVKINSLHFEDFVASPTYTVKNWDVEKDSFKTTIDERTNFNRLRAIYNYLPIVNEEASTTPFFRNSDAITQAGQTISKQLAYPNLIESEAVEYQIIEVLKLASATIEICETNLTWRALLKDIGDFIKLDVRIGSAIYENVPAMIRDIGYDPAGLKIPVKLWSMQMVPFIGWSPGYAGIVGGASATITEE